MNSKIQEFRTKIRELKSLLRTCQNGYAQFTQSGQTPSEAYYAMRALFVKTNGWFNDIWQYIYARSNPPTVRVSLANTMFGSNTESEVQKAAGAVLKEGYYVFPKLVPPEIVDQLTNFALNTPAYLQSEGFYSERPEKLFDPRNLVASNYRFDESDVVNEEAVQSLIADPLVLEISRRCFRSRFNFGTVQMWWTTPFGCANPSSSLAQMYHFDMDRVKFLNFFVYLTDVTPDSGPHCFIRNSHTRKPKCCLEDRRFSDTEIADAFPQEDHVEIVGPKGTLMIVDGRGFHKAKMPVQDNRLIFALNTCTSLFGQNYPSPQLIPKHPALISAMRDDPFLCSRFTIASERSMTKAGSLVGASY